MKNKEVESCGGKGKYERSREHLGGMFLSFTICLLLLASMCMASATVTYDGTEIVISDGAENLTSINQALNNTGLLEQLSEKEWLLKVPIKIQRSGILHINDSDCNWLKLLSMNDGNEAYIYNYIGSLQIESTKITSWTTNSGAVAPRTDSTRAYIWGQCGITNISYSNISYLGYNNYGGRAGMSITGANDFSVINSDFHNNYAGLYVYNSDNVTIANNKVSFSQDCGIRLLYVTNSTIDNNTVNYTDDYDGIQFQGENAYTTISNNTVSNTNWGGITTPAISSYLTIENNTIRNAGHVGIDLHNQIHHCTVKDCIVSGSSDQGIFVHNFGVHDNIVDNCTTYGNYDGIKIYQGYNNTVRDCVSYGNGGSGILIHSARNNLIENCTVYDNPTNINLYLNSYPDEYPNDNNTFLHNSANYYALTGTEGTHTIKNPIGDVIKVYLADYGGYSNTINIEFTDNRTFKLDGGASSHTSKTLTEVGTHTIEVEGTATDTLPPTTNTAVTPTPNESGWNTVTPVTVTFFRSDIGSSISYTNYSKISETGPWTMVTTSAATGHDAENVTDISESGFDVTLSDEGTTEIWYHSVDTNSNVETTKNVTVKIDTISTDQEHPDWWSYYIGSGEGTWGRTTTEAKTGNYSAFLKGTAYATGLINLGLIAGKSNGYSGADAYTVVPNTTYILSFWLKGDFTKIDVYAMTWNTEDGSSGRNWGTTSIGRITPTDTWTRYEGTFTTPADAKKFVLMFKAEGDSTQENLGTIYVDDVDVNIGAGNLMMNPGAEGTDFCALSGTVTTNTTQGETGLANATVTLTTRSGAEINTIQTDSTGHYEFTDVSPGNYNINATKRSYWPDSDPVTVTAEAPETADIVLCQKGDFNTNSEPADAGDLAMMADATEAGTSDVTYDLNGDGNPADEADLTLLKDVSVGVAELE